MIVHPFGFSDLVQLDDMNENQDAVEDDIAIRMNQNPIRNKKHRSEHIEYSDRFLAVGKKANQNQNRSDQTNNLKPQLRHPSSACERDTRMVCRILR